MQVKKRSKTVRSFAKGAAICCKPPLAELMEAQCWRQLPLQHVWNLGHRAFPIVGIMGALPSRLRLALKQISDLLHSITIDSTSMLGNVRNITKFEKCQPDSGPLRIDQPDVADVWDQEQHFGLIRVTFDPETQIRQNIDANRRAGEFWGLNKEEFRFRYQQNNIPILSCELDWLRAFAVYTARYFDDSVTQYARLSLGGVASLQHCLVRITTLKTFDSCGRITQVDNC